MVEGSREELRNRKKLGGEPTTGTAARPGTQHITSGTENQGKQNHNAFTSSASSRQYSMSEYCQSLRTWVFMYQSHMYMQQHMMNMMPYMACASYMQQLQQQQSTMSSTSASATTQSSGGVADGRPVGGTQQQQQNVQQNPPNRGGFAFGFRQHHLNAAQNVDNVIPQIPVLEFSVPSIFRRVVAEMIDFFLLFTAKLGFMLVIIDYLGISDTTGFMMRFLVEEIEDDTSLEELQQMLLFAFVYRVIVCMYETFFLCSHVNRFLAGATPGKFLMRLRVISLEQVQSAGPGRVQVTLPDNISFTQAFLRSVVKNFSMAFFFPACVTVFFNPHFRAAYEVLTRTMVVGAENWPDLTQNRQAGERPLVR